MGLPALPQVMSADITIPAACPVVDPKDPTLRCWLPFGHLNPSAHDLKPPPPGTEFPGSFLPQKPKRVRKVVANAAELKREPGRYVTDANERNGLLADSDEWSTPRYVYDPCNVAFGSFTLDAAASSSNRLCPEYLTKAHDAPRLHVGRHRVWMNPPYSRGNLDRFMRWALLEVVRSAPLFCCLVPHYTSEGWWQDNVAAPKYELGVRLGIEEETREGMTFIVRHWSRLSIWTHAIPGRVKFVEASGATGPARFASAIVVYERRER